MDIKRPLCLFSAVFAALIFILSLLPRPAYEKYVGDGEQIRVSGILESYERKNGHLIYHLGRVCLLRENAAYPRDDVRNSQRKEGAGGDETEDVAREDLRDEKGRKCKVLCYMEVEDTFPSSLIGRQIVLTGKAGNFAAAENEGQFDELSYYRKKGHVFKLFSCRVLSATGKGNAIKQVLAAYRDKTADFYVRTLGEKDGSVLCAMILGMRSDMDREVKSLYQASGITHILAISGLHISLLGLSLYRLLRRCGLMLPLSAAVGVSFVILYGIMVGGSSSVFRASVMLGLQILADLADRTYDLLTAMALSGLLLLMGKSEYLTDAGFLLSFLAVLGIGIFSEPLGEWFCALASSEKGWCKSLCAALAVSLSVALATTPVILWFYYAYPPYSIILNILLVPLMSVVLISGIAGGVFRMAVFLWPAKIVLLLYEKTCFLFQKFPFHRIVTGRPHLWQVIVYYLLLVVLLYLMRVIKEHRIIKALIIVFAVLCLFLPRNAGMRVDMLSVGQGDCVVIADGKGHVVLSDAGSSDVNAVGEYRLLPYLKYNAIRRIDAVYLSHPHADHYSAIEELFSLAKKEGISIGALYVSTLAARRKQAEGLKGLGGLRKTDEGDNLLVAPYERIEKSAIANGIPIRIIEPADLNAQSENITIESAGGGEQVYGDIRIQMLFPSAEKPYDAYNDENDTSMVLYCRMQFFSILLTGDVTSNMDDKLLEEMQGEGIDHVDCLKVCHHGSAMANSERMLTFLHPAVALISCGKDNSYGHPHREVLDRLDDIGCRYYVTAQTGQIRIKPVRKREGMKCSVFCGSK